MRQPQELVGKPKRREQVEQALNEVQAEGSPGQAETTLADGSYRSDAYLKTCEDVEHDVLRPEAQQKVVKTPYHKSKFGYDTERDGYTCPNRHAPVHNGVKRRKERPKMQAYRCSGNVCQESPAFVIDRPSMYQALPPDVYQA